MATNPSVKILRSQREDPPELGPQTDGVGAVSPELAEMIQKAKCKVSGNEPKNSDRIQPSTYQFRFLGCKGVVIVDHQLEGIKLRLHDLQCKFPAMTKRLI